MTSKPDDMRQAHAVEARFRLAQSDTVFGGPIFVLFEYRNVTPQAVSFAIGNARSEGFRFVPATPGVRELDPYHELGGLEPVIKLAPGETGTTTILLNRYLSFPSAGHYVIEAQFDFDVRDEALAVIARESVYQTLDVELREDPAIRSEALARLEREALQGAQPARLDAIETLGALGSQDALRILGRVLDEGGEPEVEAALAAIQRSDVAGSAAILDRFILSTTSPRLREIARRARSTMAAGSE